MTMAKRAVTADEARVRLETLCARSEQCSGEVRRKLVTWGISAAEREAIVERLIERRFVDAERYARAYVRDKFIFSRWGRRKIALGLASKRIPRDVADEALRDEIDEEAYLAALRSLLRAKARGMERPVGRDDRMRLFRFGVQRGFEPSLVGDALRTVDCDDDDD